jgi:integrase
MRQGAELTDVFLRKMRPPEQAQIDVWDRSIAGFGVRCSRAGTKTFVLVYRVRGKWRRMSLGRYPNLKLADARKRAHAALREVSAGRDPQAAKGTTRTAAPGSFGATVETFIASYCKHQNRASTAAETERMLRAVFVPVWEKHSLHDIAKTDVLDVLRGIMERGTPSAARHAFATIRKFFNWCVEQELIETSPCLTIKPPAKANSRDRVLIDAELAVIWKASADEGYPFGPILQLLALTAQRRGEVVGMRWDELQLETAEPVWMIPANRTKNNRPHVVPLTLTVVAIIKALPRFTSEFVFPARGKPEQAYSGYSKGKRAVDAAANLYDWTLHDLRRTAATGMARAGVPPHVVERILNHVSGTFKGVAGVYNRFGYLPEMREALLAWEAHIKKMTPQDASLPTRQNQAVTIG